MLNLSVMIELSNKRFWVKKKAGKIRSYWPLLLALLYYAAVLFSLLQKAIAQTGGSFIYAIDDPYIHMAMAKNLVRHGVWGVTPFAFSASSSSPLWTLLLAFLFSIFGIQNLLPFILNVAIGAGFICLVHFIVKKDKIWIIFLLLLQYLLIHVAPLSALVFFGMEHLLQIVIDFLFIYYLSQILVNEQNPSRSELIRLGVLSALCMTVRFEGIFILFIGFTLLLFRKHFRAAIVVSLGLVPIIILGLWQMAHGWMFLPNSVLLKGGMPPISTKLPLFLSLLSHKIRSTWTPDVITVNYLTPLSIGLAAALIFNWAVVKSIFKDWRLIFGVVILLIIIMHVKFAVIVHYFRYDAYLAALGLCAIVLNLQLAWPFLKERLYPQYKTYKMTVGYLILASMVWYFYFNRPFYDRGSIAMEVTPKYCHDIFRQQVQLALFLKQYFPGETVAANDIGAINFFGDLKLIDLWGLASIETAQAMRKGDFNTDFIRRVSQQQGAKIAIVHKDLFTRAGGLPSEWIQVGQLKLDDNLICWEDTVTFYAIDPAYKDRLADSLQEFRRQLPPGCEIIIMSPINSQIN